MADKWDTNSDVIDPDRFRAEEIATDDVADDWDASSEDEAPPAPAPVIEKKPVVPKPAPKPKAALAKAKTPQEIQAEINRNKLSEVNDLFGAVDKKKTGANGTPAPIANADPAKKAAPLGAGLEALTLGNDEEYRSFAAAVASRLPLETRGGHANRISFLKELLKLATDPLLPEDINSLKSTLTILFNQKTKKAAPKKKGKKVGKHINVGSSGSALDNEDTYVDNSQYDDSMF